MICRYFPSEKPSRYLKIEDEYLAYQVDSALALREFREDREFLGELINNAAEAIIYNLARAFGAKVRKPVKKAKINEDKPKPLSQALLELGGKGTVIVKK
jgi:hypothetical protein